MGIIKDSLTFDDVTLVPQYSSVLPSEATTECKLSKNLNLKIPLLSSAMDTVTESRMSMALAKLGGIGIIHRNLSIEKQINALMLGLIKNIREKEILNQPEAWQMYWTLFQTKLSVLINKRVNKRRKFRRVAIEKLAK